MRKWTVLGVVVAFAIACGCIVLAQDKPQLSEDEGKILALESVWNRAEQSKDISALSHIFAPTMVYVDYDGTLRTREQFLNYVKTDTSAPDQLVTEDVTIHSYGAFAVVSGVFRGKWSKAGKPTAMKGRFIDTWAKVDGAWQCVSSQATLITPH
jgi:ketosteroid isomerase-like protein